jgi:hypothetical protein
MGTKSRETIYGSSVRAAAERAKQAREEADKLACEAWNKRMLGFAAQMRQHGASDAVDQCIHIRPAHQLALLLHQAELQHLGLDRDVIGISGSAR